MPNKKVVVTRSNDEDMTEELINFAQLIGLDRAAPGRYSLLLILMLYDGAKSGYLNPAKIIQEINALEGLNAVSKTKPPVQNKHPPLKGLWHKHYIEGGLRSHAQNLKNALRTYGLPWLEQTVREAESSEEERFMTAEDCKAIVHDVVHGNYMRRAEDAALTGEWLIYAQHEGQNYYLCIGTHNSGEHEHLRSLIDTICCAEFHFLTELLS